MSKAVIFFAPGLEECEGLLCVDILRRAGVEVTIAAVGGQKIVTERPQHQRGGRRPGRGTGLRGL